MRQKFQVLQGLDVDGSVCDAFILASSVSFRGPKCVVGSMSQLPLVVSGAMPA